MDKRTNSPPVDWAAPDADAQFTKAIADMNMALQDLMVSPPQLDRFTGADINEESDAEYRARIIATTKTRPIAIHFMRGLESPAAGLASLPPRT